MCGVEDVISCSMYGLQMDCGQGNIITILGTMELIKCTNKIIP